MNRRMGGGTRGGNRGSSFSQQPFQSGGGGGPGLNPWQGGGISNPTQAGILSQLTSNPQLALALSSLFQTQQQQPPSLLSLNTSPAFSNNRDYGNRFNSGNNRGREVRRHEPYNKYQSHGNYQDRRRRSPKRDNKPAPKKVDKKKDEKKVKEDPREELEVTVEEEEKKESKRDWKDEKNQTEGKESGDEEKEEEKKEEDLKEGKYGGVDRKYLNCFVCNKQMWDGESMGKHVKGRAHHEMLKALEESIHICVNILRENLRLQEERKMIEFNRQTRQGKFQRRKLMLSHCAMCDLKFVGKIISHRRTEGHQRLKRYLHPTCRICDIEHPSRIEWIEHCLTPDHLRHASQSTENRVGGKDGDIITEGPEEDINMNEVLDESLHMEGNDPILELDDSLTNMVDRMPAYKPNRAVASASLKDFSGWKCELCNRSFADKEDADAHLKTKRHFHRFLEHINERFDREEKRQKIEKDAAEKKKNEDSEETKDEKDDLTLPYNAEEDEENEADSELYDPSETTEEAIKTNGQEDTVTEVAEPEIKMEVCTPVETEEVKLLPELVVEVKREVPSPAFKPVTRKSVAGPKSRRGARKQ